jgi:hypothetical protein
MLYSFPDRVEQAIVFDPSSVTAFADVDRSNQVKACACEIPALKKTGMLIEPEARMLRIYQTYEILSDLRVFHKLVYEPERHVMEIRFPFDAPDEQVKRHNMLNLANNIYRAADGKVAYANGATWLAARNDEICTAELRSAQQAGCAIDNAARGARVCPS